ncbi:MAG: phosphate ABC transporter substrate-binding protein [Chloroflexi bacterium]|nr:phosphate ABC transporter substrate-binding protein [Chloroflexota bacterium]
MPVIADLGALLLFFITACAPTPAPRATIHLTLSGADSMQPLARGLAAAFMKQRPEVNIAIQPANSQVGLRAPLDAPATIGMVARALKPAEVSQLRVVTVARDGIAVIVHRDNPINAIQSVQVTQVFAGEVSSWPAGAVIGKPIVILSREDGSGTRAAFESLAMLGKRVTRAALVLSSDEAIVEYVATHPTAIGYVSLNALEARVHPLAIDDIPISRENIENQTYPYTRPLNLVASLEPELIVREFLDFAQSSEGQKIIAEHYARAP